MIFRPFDAVSVIGRTLKPTYFFYLQTTYVLFDLQSVAHQNSP